MEDFRIHIQFGEKKVGLQRIVHIDLKRAFQRSYLTKIWITIWEQFADFVSYRHGNLRGANFAFRSLPFFGLNKYLNMYQLSFNKCRNLGADFQNVKANELPIVIFWLNGWNNESISLRKYLYPRWKTLTRGGKKIKWERIGGETMSLPIKKYIKVKDFFTVTPLLL